MEWRLKLSEIGEDRPRDHKEVVDKRQYILELGYCEVRQNCSIELFIWGKPIYVDVKD
jgi:hypothetical protein